MGVSDGFIRNGAQSETLVAGKVPGFKPAVIEGQRFDLGMFDKQFTVIGPVER